VKTPTKQVQVIEEEIDTVTEEEYESDARTLAI
jgi:hypothetical protein